MKFYWRKYTLNFKRPSGTSRGVLHSKDSWFLFAEDDSFEMPAVGECSIIEGLSPDDLAQYEAKLNYVVIGLSAHGSVNYEQLKDFPSIIFGVETLLLDMASKGSKRFYHDSFVTGQEGMRINGLIWMGEKQFMLDQIKAKLDAGFSCLKMKIGAIDFDQELSILTSIRKQFSPSELELRVDANGAFAPEIALERLKRLSDFEIHSIEQPIKQGQIEHMAHLCQETPIDIALDEELIGINDKQVKSDLLDSIKPAYIILKPSLVGGLKCSDEWIDLATSRGIGWWMTSALESNVGLNSIAQYTFSKDVSMPQGLGTGSLYLNNVDSPLYIEGEFIYHNPIKKWDLKQIQKS